MMNRFSYYIFILMLIGCNSQRKEPPAPVVYGVKSKQEIKKFSAPEVSSIDPPVEVESEIQEEQIIVVEPQDTLDLIAERYQVDRKKIIQQNQLMSPYYLFPGQNLKLPAGIRARPTTLKKTQRSVQSSNEFTEDSDLKEEFSSRSQKPLAQKRKGQTVSEREKELEEKFTQLEADLNASLDKKKGQEEDQHKVLPLKKPSTLKSKRKVLQPTEEIEETLDLQEAPLKKARALETPESNDKTPLEEELKAQSSSSVKEALVKTLKFKFPLKGNFRDNIISDFNQKEGNVKNDGLNIAAPGNTSILAAEKGRVVYAGNEMSGFGNLILLKHEGGWMTAYGHCAEISVKLKQLVGQGEVIGLVGKTGSVRETQLHFQLRKYDPKEKKPIVVDPKLYLE